MNIHGVLKLSFVTRIRYLTKEELRGEKQSDGTYLLTGGSRVGKFEMPKEARL